MQDFGHGGEHIYLVYKDRVAVHSKSSHELIQSVPTFAGRTILAAHFSKEAHTYLLSNGLVEVFDQKEKKVFRYLLLVDQLKDVDNFQRQSRTIAFTSLGRPFVFQLRKASTVPEKRRL